MSAGRNISQDRQRTTKLLRDLANGVELDGTLPNWLGHRAGNASIDSALLSGTTMAQMSVHRGAVAKHLWHLRVEHGLTVVKVGDTYHLVARPL